jgi:site-specific recombinase XerD
MKTLHTFNVHFWLKKNSIRKNGTIPIYARVRLDGNPVDISTKLETLEDHWSTEAGRVNLKVKNARLINDRLDGIYNDICDCRNSLESEGRVVTAQDIKARFLGQDTPMKTLKDLFKHHEEVEIGKLQPGTAKNYASTEKYLLSYIRQRYKSSDIQLSQINYEFVVNFEHYLRTCKPLLKSKPLTNNGIMKHMERFKKMTSIALKLEAIKKDPFTFFKARFEAYDRPVLTIAELNAIEAILLKEIGQQRVRDVFVFACYTGLSYIDVKQLKPEHIATGMDGGQWVFTKREKSGTAVKVPLLETAKAILEKYSDRRYGPNGDLILPVYSNQKCNKYLKTIADNCGIKKDISFHVARHTFATSVTLANGVPIETVSKLLGHKKLSTTQIYARVMETKIGEDMAKLQRKLRWMI